MRPRVDGTIILSEERDVAALSYRIGYRGAPETECFINKYRSEEELIAGLAEVTPIAIKVLQGLSFAKESDSLAAKLIYLIDPNGVPRGEAQKNVESVLKALRNRGALRFDSHPNVKLYATDIGEYCSAHKSVLALESPFFKKTLALCANERKQIEVYNKAAFEVIQWLYLSDTARREALLQWEAESLFQVAKVAALFEVEELKTLAELKLCSDLALESNKEKLLHDKARLRTLGSPRIDSFLDFVERLGSYSSEEAVMRKMSDPKGAWELYEEATPDERSSFAGLFNEWGRVCQLSQLLPQGAFTPLDWKSYLNFEVGPIAPLPKELYEVLERPDPWKVDKTVKETFVLIFLPGDLSYEQLNDLSSKASGRWKVAAKNGSTQPDQEKTFLRVNAAPRWVLQRRALVEVQPDRLKETGCRLPFVMETLAVNTLFFVRRGDRLLPEVTSWKTAEERASMTLCQDPLNPEGIAVGTMNTKGQLRITSPGKNTAVAPVREFK